MGSLPPPRAGLAGSNRRLVRSSNSKDQLSGLFLRGSSSRRLRRSRPAKVAQGTGGGGSEVAPIPFSFRGCFQIYCPKRAGKKSSSTLNRISVPSAGSLRAWAAAKLGKTSPRGAAAFFWRGRGALTYVTSDLRRVALSPQEGGARRCTGPIIFHPVCFPFQPAGPQPCR